MLAEAKLLGSLGLVAALAIGHQWRVHQAATDARRQCEQAHQAAAAAELQRNTGAVGAIAHEAERQQGRDAAARAGLGVAAERLRGAVAGKGLVVHPAAAGASAPAADAAGVCAQLLDEADRRLRALAAIADERGTAGAACEQSYDAVAR